MVSLVLGLLDLFGHQYLLYVTDVYFAGRYYGGSIYHIANLEYLRLGDRTVNEGTAVTFANPA